MAAFSGNPDTEITPSIEEDPALGLPIREKMEILFAVMLGLGDAALTRAARADADGTASVEEPPEAPPAA